MCEVEGGSRSEPGLMLLTHLLFNAKGIKRSYITQNVFSVCWYVLDVNMHCRIFYADK